jgi:nicotinate-nucleotide--dimethylbenzimidazole phosphoribosyltransferase
VIAAPSRAAHNAALVRLGQLAKPAGALGRLESVAAWLSSCQGECPPRPLEQVRAVVLAGDHGISHFGVSAYPRSVTAAMVRAFVAGDAVGNVLARQHGVALRVLDIGVDDDLDDLPPEVSAYHVRRSSGLIDSEDALTADEVDMAVRIGARIAAEEIHAGADLLILGDLGIGNTTPAAALIASTFGVGAEEVTGRGTGVDDDRLAHKTRVIAVSLSRAASQGVTDPLERLACLGSADLAAGVGFLIRATRAGVPILLDGLISLAELAVAEDLAPGVVAWCMAGHRSPEPAQQLAMDKLGLTPVLDLGMRLGEGAGALAALPLLRSAALLMRETALLANLTSPN